MNSIYVFGRLFEAKHANEKRIAEMRHYEG